MKYQNKTKRQLITELEQLQSRIAELERTEELLKESEDKYRTIYENVNDHLIYIDKYGTILGTNDRKATYGRSPKELVGKNFSDLGYFDDEDLPKYLNLFKDVITGKKSLSGVELEIKHKAGYKIPVEVNISLIRKNDKIEGFLCVVRNITERKQAEEALRASEEKYRGIFEQAVDSIVLMDAETGEMVEFNDSACENLGYTHEEFEKLKIVDFEASESPDKVIEHLSKITREGSDTFETKHRTKDGKIRNILVNARSINIPDKSYILGIWRDITERKRAEEALRESEELYKRVFESHLDALFILDASLPPEIKESNEAAERIFGYERHEMLGRRTDFLHVDDLSLKEFQEQIYQAVQEDRICHIPEFKMKRADGTIFPTEHNVGTLTDYQGNRIGWVSLVRDITERKQADAALHESEEKYRSLVESSENPIYLVDENFQILYANQKYLSRLGKSLEEVINQKVSDFDIPGKADEFVQKAHGVFKTHKPVTYEHTSARDNRNFLRTLSPVIDPDTDVVTAVTVISKDITELKQAEKQLRESQEQLRSLSAHLQSIREEERSEMARHIHDVLGQELTALKMDLAWLRSQLPEDQERLLEKTDAIAELTDSIIQSVKDIATRLRPAMLDDLGVIAALEWEMEEFEKRLGIGCEFTILTDKIDLDPNRSTAVYRIFVESLTNIARHAQATAVSASLDVLDGILEIKIEDNGIGITKDQVANPRSFGLIGIRERVLQFQGETIITGRKGQGTTLTVRIPLDEDTTLHK